MTKSTKTISQNYPRIQDENSPFYGCLDDSKLKPHTRKISIKKLETLILLAIDNANTKSSREILSIPADASPEDVVNVLKREGKELFKYFKKYCGDPASTAHQINGKSYKEVGEELFRNRTLQKERMNSGWRYQFLSTECAHHSKRFSGISDIGAAEGDFTALIGFLDDALNPLSLYVSVKNRSNTMGGQDWPKAIHALENVAKNDKNRKGPYCCVFGIAMDRGYRHIKREQKSKRAHSENTEVWFSDFFWPFFTNYSYEEIMRCVLDVLINRYKSNDLAIHIKVPEKLLDSFRDCCNKAGLINEGGVFNDPYKLVRFFCLRDASKEGGML